MTKIKTGVLQGSALSACFSTPCTYMTSVTFAGDTAISDKCEQLTKVNQWVGQCKLRASTAYLLKQHVS